MEGVPSMTERFNSGLGGYTCDTCSRLLWSGFDGDQRVYCYEATPETVLSRKGKHYCSQICLCKSDPSLPLYEFTVTEPVTMEQAWSCAEFVRASWLDEQAPFEYLVDLKYTTTCLGMFDQVQHHFGLYLRIPITRVVTGIECPRCKAQVWSRHRHDMRYCGCGYSAVDGGRDYLKVSHGAEYSHDWSDELKEQSRQETERLGRPVFVKIEVPEK